MNILIITGIYISGIFVARWLNKIAYQMSNDYEKAPIAWLFSWVTVLMLFIGLFWLQFINGDNWFTGKNWKRKGDNNES